LKVNISTTSIECGKSAAEAAARIIRNAVETKSEASIILATGASQFQMLEYLVREKVDWSKVTAYHLDEYLNLPDSHPASFRKYLQERFVEKVEGLKKMHFVRGDSDNPNTECDRLGSIIQSDEIDVACVGIGENSHLAFNDPHADLDSEDPYHVVYLDEECRIQQLQEGWFPTLDDVPGQAISMSIKQIMASNEIVCTVPDKRKAQAVRNTLNGKITNTVPASVLQAHPKCTVFLDTDSASLLNNR
jgi:glucosamine-6-phosphate deaminase